VYVEYLRLELQFASATFVLLSATVQNLVGAQLSAPVEIGESGAAPGTFHYRGHNDRGLQCKRKARIAETRAR